MNAAKYASAVVLTKNEYVGGTKKYSTTNVDSNTATSPDAVPPNHALIITAPRNRNGNG